MKALKKFIFILTDICLLMTCSGADEFLDDDSLELKCGHAHHGELDQDRYVTMRSTGLKVHYRIIGKGPVDIVFIPGWTNPLTVYTMQFEFFKDKARCIYIELCSCRL